MAFLAGRKVDLVMSAFLLFLPTSTDTPGGLEACDSVRNILRSNIMEFCSNFFLFSSFPVKDTGGQWACILHDTSFFLTDALDFLNRPLHLI